MVICSRCEQPVDETTRTTCPLCFTPLPVQGAAQPPAASPPAPSAPQSYAPQTGGVMPLAPPDAAPSAVASLNAGQAPMPVARPMPAAPTSVPIAAPSIAANQRMTLTGEVIEAPAPMSSAMPAGNSQYQARSSAGAPRVQEKAERSGPSIGVIVMVLVALGGVGGGWWFWMHRTNPKDQAQKFLDATKSLDYKGMYEAMEVDPEKYKSEEDYVSQNTDGLSKVPGMKDMITNMLSSIQFKAGTPKYNGMNEATVPVAISGSFALPIPGQAPQELNKSVDMPMKNFNGIWKVAKTSAFAGNTGNLMSKMGGK